MPSSRWPFTEAHATLINRSLHVKRPKWINRPSLGSIICGSVNGPRSMKVYGLVLSQKEGCRRRKIAPGRGGGGRMYRWLYVYSANIVLYMSLYFIRQVQLLVILQINLYYTKNQSIHNLRYYHIYNRALLVPSGKIHKLPSS